ncbi:MAG: PRC-barrel domain containing protein [Oscillochloris sp.]|nr:PRC-barrel domain containing protein [Oscillochloris sp.]
MLRSTEEFRGMHIGTHDDEIGKVDQFLFDDEHWTIRYMVVNTGNWLLKDLVLISPQSIRSVDWDDRRIDVNLSRRQVEESPDIAADRPVSRQMENQLARHYGYEPYWYGPSLWGASSFPYYGGGIAGYASLDTAATERGQRPSPVEEGDERLRSTKEVSGYHIGASDGEIGHVADFLMDDEIWAIRYMVIDTRNWWPGKRVVISPEWVGEVKWADRMVDVDLTRAMINDSPEYDPNALSRDYEQQLYRHYQRRGYWEERG